jgi:ribonucleoside-triphosphate reductase
VGDSIEGWADAVKVLIESYFYGKKEVEFDFRDIRPKGAALVTAGGKAPGPQPLKDCVYNMSKVLDNAIAERGKNCKLKPIEAHSIQCHIADAVLAGGIRRAAMICLFSFADQEMMECKSGTWWEANPHFGRANNSVVMIRHKAKRGDFDRLWKAVEASGSGEPGIFFSNDKEMGANPCLEASLKPYTFCNLTTMNAADISSQEEFEARCKASAFISTLQASYTDFHYLREIWRTNTEKDALIGPSITGLASEWFLNNINLRAGAEVVLKENERAAKLLGINKAARTTLLKPDGTTSLLLGCSSGVHAWYAPYYLRRIRVGKNEAIYTYLSIYNPSILENDVTREDTAIICIPVKSPDGAITRNENTLDALARVKKFHEEWIQSGHRKGSNTHNVSVTVFVKPNEWDVVGDWMWENRYSYNGIAVLPYDNGTYVQPPFEEITEAEYLERAKHVENIDLSMVLEGADHTNLSGEIACAGGACEIK